MVNYNYGTAVNKLIDNYQEMLEILVQARLASDRVDDWKNTLDVVINPEQTKVDVQKRVNVASLQSIQKLENIYQWMCGECDEIRVDDARVLAGMKCGHCAYGY